MMQVFEHKGYLRTVEPRVRFTVLDGSLVGREKKREQIDANCVKKKSYKS